MLRTQVYKSIGVKRHALLTMRYISRYIVHDMLCSMIHLLVLAGKQRPIIPACDQEHCTPPATATCAVIMHMQWIKQWRPRQSFQVQYFCVEFPRFIGIYWLLSVSISCSFLITIDRTVSYRIVISMSVSQYISSAQIYRCNGTTMNHFTPTNQPGIDCMMVDNPTRQCWTMWPLYISVRSPMAKSHGQKKAQWQCSIPYVELIGA